MFNVLKTLHYGCFNDLVCFSKFHHQRVQTLEGSTDSLVPVGAIDICVDRAVVVAQGVYPITAIVTLNEHPLKV